MGHWNYTNIGASAKDENKRHVEKIFEYIGYNPNPDYSESDEGSLDEPDVYFCESSEYGPSNGKIKKPFVNMQYEDLLDLLNAVFPKTNVYIHHAEGSNTSDTWEIHDTDYNTDDMTCYRDSSYTSYDCGPNGTSSSKARFALKAPKMEYVTALIDLSTADGNGELTALLLELSRKLKDGLVVYEEDENDERTIGEEYDVVDDVSDGEEEDEDLAYLTEEMPYEKFIEMYKINPDTLYEDSYEEFLSYALDEHENPFEMDYEEFMSRLRGIYKCEPGLDPEAYEEVRAKVLEMFEEDE